MAKLDKNLAKTEYMAKLDKITDKIMAKIAKSLSNRRPSNPFTALRISTPGSINKILNFCYYYKDLREKSILETCEKKGQYN